ncbi:hypothetical protein FOCC_FOCC000310, partial [Frankliniella occidentalis]
MAPTPRKKSGSTRKSLSKIFSKDKVNKTLGDLSIRLRPRRERRSVLPAKVRAGRAAAASAAAATAASSSAAVVYADENEA